MDRWTDEGTEPPESQYGLIEKGTLVTPENLDFPKIPGVERSTRIHKAYRADYGPKFRSEGIVTEEPPEIGRAYPMMVPAVNEDGNEIVGIQMPEHSVPLATHTGWNLFNADAAPPRALQHAGLLHSVSKNRGGAEGEGRSTALHRRALPQPRALSRSRSERCR